MNGAQIQFVGNLVRDPEELRYTATEGVPYITVPVAVNTYNGPNREAVTEFYNVTAWRRQAEGILNRCRKGQSLMVTGQLTIRRYWRADGQPGVALDVNARDVHHRFTNREAPTEEEPSQEPPSGDMTDQEPADPETQDSAFDDQDDEAGQPIDLSPTN